MYAHAYGVSLFLIMATILNLETATTNCSVCVARGGVVLAIKEHNTPNYSHAEQLHVFISEVLKEADIEMGGLDAVAVSKGPGSYTGLRIGVSAAKGLCYALDIPLISIPTLESMAHQVKDRDTDVIIPVLDARRMEVYSAVFDRLGHQIRETRAEIVNEASFVEYQDIDKVLLVGSGAEKCEELLSVENFNYDNNIIPSAAQMAHLSELKFNNDNFEDVAYFEPYYLKDFMLQGKKEGNK